MEDDDDGLSTVVTMLNVCVSFCHSSTLFFRFPTFFFWFQASGTKMDAEKQSISSKNGKEVMLQVSNAKTCRFRSFQVRTKKISNKSVIFPPSPLLYVSPKSFWTLGE